MGGASPASPSQAILDGVAAWDFGSGDFTIEMWVKLDRTKNTMFLHQQSGEVQGGFEFDFQAAPSILVFARSNLEGAIAPRWSPVPGAWDNPANWNPARIPGTNDLAVICNGATVTLTGPVRVGALFLGSGVIPHKLT